MTERFSFDRLDPEGRRLEVTGDGDNIMFQVQDPHGPHGRVNALYDLDADAAVNLAHDLLERALSYADCDEITVAVTALRELAERERSYDRTDHDIPCDEFDWHSLLA